MGSIEKYSLIPAKATWPLVEIKIVIDGNISVLFVNMILHTQTNLKLQFELYFLYLFTCNID